MNTIITRVALLEYLAAKWVDLLDFAGIKPTDEPTTLTYVLYSAFEHGEEGEVAKALGDFHLLRMVRAVCVRDHLDFPDVLVEGLDSARAAVLALPVKPPISI